jgi:hypothetical protein
VSSIAGLTDRGTVAAYVIVNTTNSGPNYTTSRDVTASPGTGPKVYETSSRWQRVWRVSIRAAGMTAAAP